MASADEEKLRKKAAANLNVTIAAACLCRAMMLI
jgi:hypothetical protein